MKIRPEKTLEFAQIYDFVKVAFQTAKFADGDEQDYVDKLRCSGNYIPQLALVAEENGKLVGHIMLTKTVVTATGGSKFGALLLAPLSVALEHRNRGIGSQLVKESFRLAKNLGFKVVFVMGDPAFYSRFGFKSSASFGIRHVPLIPDPFIMVCELFPDALVGVAGTVTFT